MSVAALFTWMATILHREGESFTQRFTRTISHDARTISGRWEKAENGPESTADFY
jgi:hypothetical protein